MKCFGQVKFYGRIFRAGCQSDNSFSARFKRCPYRSAIQDSYTFPLQSLPSACGDAQTTRWHDKTDGLDIHRQAPNCASIQRK